MRVSPEIILVNSPMKEARTGITKPPSCQLLWAAARTAGFSLPPQTHHNQNSPSAGQPWAPPQPAPCTGTSGLPTQGAAQPVVAVIYTDVFPWDSHSQPSDSKNPGATVLALQDLESYSSTLTREWFPLTGLQRTQISKTHMVPDA